MTRILPLTGLACLAAAGLGLADDPPAPVPPAPPAVVQDPAPPAPVPAPAPARKSVNVIDGSGNGFGNTVIVDGPAGGVTVVRDTRNGVGNRLIVGAGGVWTDLPAVGGATFTAPGYRGKATKFWAVREWSEDYDCYLYWSAKDKQWFRYLREEDAYRPILANVDRP